MSAQPIVITPEEQVEWRAFAERAVQAIHLHQGDARRLRLGHAVARVELGVLRMALTRGDTKGAFEMLDVLEGILARHARDMAADQPLPDGVACLHAARAARAASSLFDGGCL